MKVAFIISEELQLHAINNNIINELSSDDVCDFYVDDFDIKEFIKNKYDYIFFDANIKTIDFKQLFQVYHNYLKDSKMILLMNNESVFPMKGRNRPQLDNSNIKEPTFKKNLFAISRLYNAGRDNELRNKEFTEQLQEGLLTKREEEIMRLFSNGSSYKDVSSDLDISVDTVRSHVKNIYKKLNVKSKTEAVLKMIYSDSILY
ncbi:MAG TPA: LuxR C-terminal-related transcriptional regulator [Candidatus Nitrosocosmicus sp.]|jgi:DNA-binding CsgD family transcriptional regulator